MTDDTPYEPQKGYHVSVVVNEESIVFHDPISDPFVHQGVITRFSLRDRIKHVFTGYEHQVSVIVGADRDTIFKVMNLDQFEPVTVEGDAAPQGQAKGER